MKKIVFLTVLILAVSAVSIMAAAQSKPAEAKATKVTITADESPAYYPAHVGNVLYLKGKKNNAPEKTLFVKAEIKSLETRDGVEYYYFFAPQVEIRYLINVDKQNGVSMRIIKYPFPFFNASIEVTLTPQMTFMKYPLKVGEKWTYKGRGEATILGFIKLGRDLKTEFEVVRRETVKTEAGDFDAYHIVAIVDAGDGKPPTTEKYWYAKGLGYTIAETSGHRADLVGYRIFDEATGTWNEKLPEGVEKYE